MNITLLYLHKNQHSVYYLEMMNCWTETLLNYSIYSVTFNMTLLSRCRYNSTHEQKVSILYLNNKKKPYISTTMPTTGHPTSTTNIPPKKKAVPLTLCFWKKNLNVLSRPMTNVRPVINSICKQQKTTGQQLRMNAVYTSSIMSSIHTGPKFSLR